MFFDELKLDRNSGTPLYRQIEEAVVEAMRAGRIAPGTRFPGIRSLSAALGVSKPTIEAAMRYLAVNGYVTVRQRSGCVASDIGSGGLPAAKSPERPASPPVLFDFSTNAVDMEVFPRTLWRRSINRAAKSRLTLSSYGDPQGEEALRRTLSSHVLSARGVVCGPERMVIGAGLQSLVPLLLRLLPPGENQAAFEGRGFPRLETVFGDYGWKTSRVPLEELFDAEPRVICVGSEVDGGRRRLRPDERLRLLRRLSERGGFILEDDYLGEFRPESDPATSLQGMSPASDIVYLGSFSRLLTPSLRVSFMVVPPSLEAGLSEVLRCYNQTSSTLEQLALADFVETGAMRRHVKALRAASDAKAARLSREIARLSSGAVETAPAPSGLAIHVRRLRGAFPEDIVETAGKQGVAIRRPDRGTLLLGVTGIPSSRVTDAAAALLRVPGIFG